MTGRSENRLVLRFGRPARPRKHFRGCVFSAVFRQQRRACRRTISSVTGSLDSCIFHELWNI